LAFWLFHFSTQTTNNHVQQLSPCVERRWAAIDCHGTDQCTQNANRLIRRFQVSRTKAGVVNLQYQDLVNGADMGKAIQAAYGPDGTARSVC
jgi:hypothetical protein